MAKNSWKSEIFLNSFYEMSFLKIFKKTLKYSLSFGTIWNWRSLYKRGKNIRILEIHGPYCETWSHWIYQSACFPKVTLKKRVEYPCRYNKSSPSAPCPDSSCRAGTTAEKLRHKLRTAWIAEGTQLPTTRTAHLASPAVQAKWGYRTILAGSK